jgi:beta-lactam-binding protein with PASTA domain
MPRVVGQNEAAAEAKLRALGFEEITFGSADDSASVVLLPQNWKVTRQDPRPGAKVDPRSTAVVLTMVKLS